MNNIVKDAEINFAELVNIMNFIINTTIKINNRLDNIPAGKQEKIDYHITIVKNQLAEILNKACYIQSQILKIENNNQNLKDFANIQYKQTENAERIFNRIIQEIENYNNKRN